MAESSFSAASNLTTTESSTTSSSSSTSSDRYSVTDSDKNYIPTSKSLLYDEDFRSKTYFQLGKAETTSSSTTASSTGTSTSTTTSSSSSSSSSSSTTTTDAATTFNSSDFWQLILTDYSENHTEKYTPLNTIAESFVWMVTGPNPIEVTLSGMLPISGSYDYRTNFLYNYVAAFRARQLAAYEKTLTLVVKDTTMRLLLTSITLNEKSDSPDFVEVAMTGYGYKYRNTGSTEELYTGYYGTTAAVPTSATTSAAEEKKTEPTASTETVEDTQKNEALQSTPATSDVEVVDVTFEEIGQASDAKAKAEAAETASSSSSSETKTETKTDVVTNPDTIPPAVRGGNDYVNRSWS